nr:helix-turn-helix domain-containing protein [Microlunatus panaciterrae]
MLLRAGDRSELERLTRSSTAPASAAQRARIVLLASEGVANYVIAERVGVTRPTVNLWRSRYAARGLSGLGDEKRPGRPRTVDRAAVIAATLTPPPQSLGVTHWSSRLLAPRLGVDHATVAAVWKDYGVKPWEGGDDSRVVSSSKRWR